MTQPEKKASNSENIELYPMHAALLNSLHLEFHYTMLKGSGSASFRSPVDGYINLLQADKTGTCISPYFIDQHAYLIHGGQNIIHAIKHGQLLEWKNSYDNNTTVLLFIPSAVVQDFAVRFMQDMHRFENGLLTDSDNRIMMMIDQITDLLNQDCSSQLNKLRLQALFTEVLLHQIEGLYAENDHREIIVNKEHFDKIQLAKRVIDADLSKSYTITELAKKVGTNEQYLKMYFKQHFGKTVMSYITEAKMEHAKSLILTGDYRVSDVARLTGYKHSTHFTTAFKKYFGFIPNSLKYTFLIAQEGAQILAEIEGFLGNL